MKKLLYFFVVAFVISSCSKKIVDPDPSEQVLGTYKGISVTQSSGGTGIVYDLTSADFKDDQYFFDVSKKGASTITINTSNIYKDNAGKTLTEKNAIETVDLKNPANGEFEMYNGATKIGKVGNGSLTLENIINTTDPNGKAVTYKLVFISKKQQFTKAYKSNPLFPDWRKEIFFIEREEGILNIQAIFSKF